ncbi:MAG: ABC transporter permease [Halanaerobiales bacterium]|nr:ABC transporter permease [Halanaerobiales bacterium]
MNFLSIIQSVIKKDMKEFFRNKTIIIVILLPLLASLFFLIIEDAGLNKYFNIGLVDDINSDFNSFVTSNIANINVYNYDNIGRAESEIGDRIDGIIHIHNKNDFELYLNAANTNSYFFLQNQLENIIDRYLGIEPQYELQVNSVNQIEGKLNFLPIWLTITITMIGVLIISGNLAEEKENKTMDAIYITPANNLLFLIGKILSGVILSTVTALIMLFINGFYRQPIKNVLLVVLAIFLSSLVFNVIGLIIGAKSDSQSSARSMGTIIYFPLLFPTLIYNLSDFTEMIAKFFPTYYLFQVINNLLSISVNYSKVWYNLSILMVFGVVLSSILFYVFKRVYR